MLDLNKPLENKVLKELFEEMKKGLTSELQNRILEEVIMRAYFLSCVKSDKWETEKNSEGIEILSTPSTIDFYMITSEDEKVFYPVFSDWEELRKWNTDEDIKTLIFSFDDYAKMVLSSDVEGFVINPFGASFTFKREWLEVLVKEKEERLKIKEIKIEKGHEVQVYQEEEYPEKLKIALKYSCERNKNIKRIWLLTKNDNGNENYFGVVESIGNEKENFEEIARDVVPYLENREFDIVAYSDEFYIDVLKYMKVFYEKV